MPATIVRLSRVLPVAWFAMSTAHCLFAQTAVPPELRFDAASVKPNLRAACQGRWDFSAAHGTLAALNAPLLRIISRAYDLTDDRVSGPAWLESQCFDIFAKASGDVPNGDLMQMLQTLLRERFHLAAQRESAERALSVLVVDKGGSKMHPYGAKAPVPPSKNDGSILFMARHMPDLCERLGKVTGRPVVDKTGLTGDYMIVLTYHPLGSPSGDATELPSDIVAAVREQLGLRLVSQRGAVEILKIEGIDKVPAEN